MAAAQSAVGPQHAASKEPPHESLALFTSLSTVIAWAGLALGASPGSELLAALGSESQRRLAEFAPDELAALCRAFVHAPLRRESQKAFLLPTMLA